MIPKIIHYCWFGGKPLPKSARRCIASWRKFFPDYEIREWNESNFDVTMTPYTAEAYAANKFAFVSDFARFQVLHECGGIYFDTDVEVIRPMEDILERGAFMALEKPASCRQLSLYVNPGLGIASQAGHPFWKAIIARYAQLNTFNPDSQGTVCKIVTDLLAAQGTLLRNEIIEVPGLTIYPSDYFCPQAMMGAPIELTDRTRSIHHFDCTWLPAKTRLKLRIIALLPQFIQKALRHQ